MVDQQVLAYSYKGSADTLLAAVRKACVEMNLNVSDEQVTPTAFELTAGEKTNWLSTNWPVKFNLKAEPVGDTVALTIRGASGMGSITQSNNNANKAQGLLSLIAAYAPNP